MGARRFGLLGLFICALAPERAEALSPELAKSCRDAALKAYPYQLPGTGPGNAQNEIHYYEDCLAKDGKIGPPNAGSPSPTGAH